MVQLHGLAHVEDLGQLLGGGRKATKANVFFQMCCERLILSLHDDACCEVRVNRSSLKADYDPAAISCSGSHCGPLALVFLPCSADFLHCAWPTFRSTSYFKMDLEVGRERRTCEKGEQHYLVHASSP